MNLTTKNMATAYSEECLWQGCMELSELVKLGCVLEKIEAIVAFAVLSSCVLNSPLQRTKGRVKETRVCVMTDGRFV